MLNYYEQHLAGGAGPPFLSHTCTTASLLVLLFSDPVNTNTEECGRHGSRKLSAITVSQVDAKINSSSSWARLISAFQEYKSWNSCWDNKRNHLQSYCQLLRPVKQWTEHAKSKVSEKYLSGQLHKMVSNVCSSQGFFMVIVLFMAPLEAEKWQVPVSFTDVRFSPFISLIPKWSSLYLKLILPFDVIYQVSFCLIPMVRWIQFF